MNPVRNRGHARTNTFRQMVGLYKKQRRILDFLVRVLFLTG